MANIVFPTPPSSAFDPPPSRWWPQLHSLFIRRKELTIEEKSALSKRFGYGYITNVAILVIVPFIIIFFNKLRCHVSFSVKSISVSPTSAATWHVDFHVKNPTSRCPIFYDEGDVYVKLNSLNAAVLKTSHTPRHGSFSVDLATEVNNQSGVVRVPEMEIKVSAKKKRLIIEDEYGNFNIVCYNLTLGHEEIKCHSSFKSLKECC